MTHIKHIKELEKRLRTGKEFSEIADYFLTYLGEDKSFLRACEPCLDKNEILFKLVGKAILDVFPETKSPLAMSPFLKRFPNSDFIHGPVLIKDHMLNVIFFEKCSLGLVIFTLSDSMMHFCRITAMPTSLPQ